MENEIKVGEFIRTKLGDIAKVIEFKDELILDTVIKFNGMYRKYLNDGELDFIVKHSSNLKDLIQKDDFVNKCRVYEVEEKGITVYQTVENSATDYNWISFDEIEEIVTKEMMESISYKVKQEEN